MNNRQKAKHFKACIEIYGTVLISHKFSSCSNYPNGGYFLKFESEMYGNYMICQKSKLSAYKYLLNQIKEKNKEIV